jgi:5-methylcytosine-specific restriction endonuclease McrA
MSQDWSLTMSDSKTCSKCLQIKTLDSFYRASKGKQTHESACIECRNASSRKNYFDNRETRAIQIALWQQNNRERKRHNEKLWRRNTPEPARKWRQNNVEKSRDYTKAFRQKNPELSRVLLHRRRARILSAKSYLITKTDIRSLLQKPCIYCGAKSTHIDHVIPLARGGSNSIGNLAGACQSCNLSKGPKLVMEWKIWKGKC